MKRHTFAIIELVGGRAVASGILAVLLAILEGAGVMMLAPMLSFIGVVSSQGFSEEINSFFTLFFESTGIPKTLISVLLFYIGIIALREVLIKKQALLTAKISHEVVKKLRNKLFRAISHTRWSYFTQTRHAYFSHSLTSDINRIGNFANVTTSIFSNILLFLVYLFLAIQLSFILTGIACITATIIFFLLKALMKESKETGKEQTGIGKRMHSEILEFLNGMKLTKIFCAETQVIQKFNNTIEVAEKNSLSFVQETSKVNMNYNMMSVLILSLYLYFSIEYMDIGADSLLLLLFVFFKMKPQFSSLTQKYQQLLHMIPAFDSYNELLTSCQKENEEIPSSLKKDIILAKNVSFRDVSFQYSSSKKSNALNSINITIPVKETTAIIGHSGSGKSTFADILMGLIYPTQGGIFIDGQPLTKEMIHSWRMAISYVPQDTFLFHDTVRENLLWVKPDAKEDELWEALKTAAAKNFVEELPDGINTILGERGIRLSGGERQRIALARAVLMKPKILILDEATSSLDEANERYIRDSIHKLHGNVTIIIIAHRMTTVREADNIIILEKGEIIESGKRKELLLHKDGKFYEFCQL